MAKKPAIRDPHRDVPKDEDGDPIFLVLPDGVRASYERKMAKCKAGWQATGDPAFVSEAEVHAHLHRQPKPLWHTEAVIELCAKRRTKGYATRVLNAAVKWQRFDAVREAKRSGMTWDEAYEEAAKRLRGATASGEASTMKDTYVEVAADLKNGRGGRYLWPLTSNNKLGDVLRRKPPPR
jgi:hypothetical protein